MTHLRGVAEPHCAVGPEKGSGHIVVLYRSGDDQLTQQGHHLRIVRRVGSRAMKGRQREGGGGARHYLGGVFYDQVRLPVRVAEDDGEALLRWRGGRGWVGERAARGWGGRPGGVRERPGGGG